MGGREREPRLADAARSGQRDQPRAAAHQRRQRRKLGSAADEARLGRGKRVPGATGERAVVPEDRLLELLQGRPGLEPELVAQRLAGAREHLERRALAVAAVEREHQLPAQPLSARMLRHERLELGHELAFAADRQVGLDAILEHGEPQLFQPGHLRLRERLVPHVLVGGPAPQRERLAEGRGRRVRLLGPAALDQVLEAREIELAGLELEAVAGSLAGDPLGAEPAAQGMHLHLERVRSRRRRVLAPQRVDQPVA